MVRARGYRLIDRDKGWKALKRQLQEAAKKPHVVVGIFGDKARESHGPTFTNAQVASVHEFGLGNAPERSFIRGTIDAKASQIQALSRQLASQVLLRRLPIRQALGLLGAFVEGLIKERISRGIPPPNAPSTIARKGSSTPLINTGQMRASVSHEVRRA
jgi:hypothetical protein